MRAQASTFATRCRKSAWIHPPRACIHPRGIHPRMRLSIPPSTSKGSKARPLEGSSKTANVNIPQRCLTGSLLCSLHVHVPTETLLTESSRDFLALSVDGKDVSGMGLEALLSNS